MIELTVPEVGESIQEVEIAQWLKQEGDWVKQDEDVVEIDSEKASLPVPAPTAGRIVKIHKQAGDKAEIGDVLAEIDDSAEPEQQKKAEQKKEAPQKKTNSREKEEKPAKPAAKKEEQPEAKTEPRKEDEPRRKEPEEDEAELEPESSPRRAVLTTGSREEEVVPMSMIRRRIASRLVESQQQSALLTTFNEVDMSAVIKLRKELREPFLEQHGIKLGFMSFFVKTAIEALKKFPGVNAEIRGENIVYHHYYDIGIAIGGGKGLVVPVLRNAEQLSFAEVELAIEDFAVRAVKNRLKPDELTGGTFTISNGGVYGSLLSTPIINPPQSGVLGMHAILDRPVAVAGQVVIRPMMYVALTYDHRLVDGREAVGFLRRMKELLEEPSRILLEV